MSKVEKTTQNSPEKKDIESVVKYFRGIQRVHSVPKTIESVETQYDFKISEYGAVDVIEIGKRDWLKLVQSHRNEVGLDNVIRLAQAFGLDPRNKPFALREDEALDQSYVPQSLSEVKEDFDKKSKSDKVLGKYAEVLGISKDAVLDLMISGKFADVMVEKMSPKTEEKTEVK